MFVPFEIKVVSDIASVWGWHIVAIIFFVQGLNFLVFNKIVWAISMFALFTICESLALRKKWKLEENNCED